MSVEVVAPAVGESITEGTLSRWLKKDGDAVRAGDPIVELETEKATTEVPAPADGQLKIKVQEGQTVSVGAVLGRIDEKAPAAESGPDKKKAERTSAKASPSAPSKAKPEEATPPDTPPEEKKKPAQEEPALSPAVRHLLEAEGLDANQLTGTGRAGRITKEDVLTHLQQRQPPPPAAPTANQEIKKPEAPASADAKPAGLRETRQRLSSIRQRIAERLVAAQNIAAILTTFNEADLSAILDLRSQYQDRFKEKHGVRLGFMPFFVKACIEALRAFPVVNARLEGTEVVYPHYYDIGVAVSTEKGLMVPVLRDADRLSFAQIDKQLAELAQKARDAKIAVTDLQGGTFTITNGGVFGSLLSTPILNPPQSGILGMHTIQKRPVAVNDQVVIRPMMYLALSYDHRLIDGREAVQFLVRVKECVEDPKRLLLEV